MYNVIPDVKASPPEIKLLLLLEEKMEWAQVKRRSYYALVAADPSLTIHLIRK